MRNKISEAEIASHDEERQLSNSMNCEKPARPYSIGYPPSNIISDRANQLFFGLLTAIGHQIRYFVCFAGKGPSIGHQIRYLYQNRLFGDLKSQIADLMSVKFFLMPENGEIADPMSDRIDQ
ncbi:hypothetical protein [Paenibacillus humicus]|uniref:hypothetical protein n=1 Tax=Paenibacillus humicus TaxID=412861 RepID=UPI003F192309